MANPLDTVRVYGGRPLDQIDADEVRTAAGRLAILAGHLQAGLAACRHAASQLDLAALQYQGAAAALESWVPPPMPELPVAAKSGRGWPTSSGLEWHQQQQQQWEQQNAANTAEWNRRQQRAAEFRIQALKATRTAAELQPIMQCLSALQQEAHGYQDKLLRAAGLYEEQETRAARLFSNLLRYGTAARVYWATQHPVLAGAEAVAVAAPVAASGYLAHRVTAGASTKALPSALVTGIAGFSDELVGGLSLGIAVSSPRLAGRLTTTGGIAVLSTLVRFVAPPGKLQVTETLLPTSAFGPSNVSGLDDTRGSHDANGSGAILNSTDTNSPDISKPNPHAPKMSKYQGTPSATVMQALTRVADLHPFDPAAPPAPHAEYSKQGRGGLPTGTVGIERVAHQDGTVSWTVLIPGTQNFAPGDHAFDGVTDLDLMAHRQSQVGEQVIEALKQAGVGSAEPVVLVGHSLGGIAAMSLASSKAFNSQFQVGGVITAGSPTATFTPPPGVPVLHLENDEEVVSNLDGESGSGNPRTKDRVTVTRRLAASDHLIDQQAASGLEGAHPIETHQRTYELALETGNDQVHEVTERLNALLDGESAHTRYFTGRRE